MEFSMEIHGIPWKTPMGNSMENSMEFHRIFHGIPWKIFMKIHQMFKWNSMEFHGIFHEIPWNFPRISTEFHRIS
jgi:hypothetical protein